MLSYEESLMTCEKNARRMIERVDAEPTGYIVLEKFEALAVRLLTEEAMSNKRHTEDEILAS
eukprot:62682-Rhodomonas_salina.2